MGDIQQLYKECNRNIGDANHAIDNTKGKAVKNKIKK